MAIIHCNANDLRTCLNYATLVGSRTYVNNEKYARRYEKQVKITTSGEFISTNGTTLLCIKTYTIPAEQVVFYTDEKIPAKAEFCMINTDEKTITCNDKNGDPIKIIMYTESTDQIPNHSYVIPDLSEPEQPINVMSVNSKLLKLVNLLSLHSDEDQVICRSFEGRGAYVFTPIRNNNIMLLIMPMTQ